jgi:hypothetical protein
VGFPTIATFVIRQNLKMTDYKKYSLENLENWLHDAMSSGDATPQEIYDTIYKVATENYYHHKHHAGRAYELMEKLSGNVVFHVDPKGNEVPVTCDNNDASPECKTHWNDFWEDNMPPWGHSDMEAFCNQKEDRVVRWQLPVQVDASNGDYFVLFPDDLLAAANLASGDDIEWIDKGDGTYLLKKVTRPLTMDEC